MNFLKSKKLQLLFLLIGAICGFLYWKFVGCSAGSCPIKSVWYWSTLIGAILGYLLSDIIGDFIKKRKKKDE
jgi:hypothetical protein